MMRIFVYRNLNEIVTMESAHHKQGRFIEDSDLSIIKKATVIFNEEKILWVGTEEKYLECLKNKTFDFIDDSSKLNSIPSFEEFDLTGHILTPEIVDSHTHLVFAGNRADEYAMRLNGATYEQIALNGGGIISSMKAINELTREQLFQESVEKIKKIHELGIGTIEIKSGYGLNFAKEWEISQIIFDLKKYFFPKVQIINTFMAAHAVPPSFEKSESYMNQVVLPLLDRLAPLKIIDCVDIFHEKNYFNDDDLKNLANLTRLHQLKLKIHGDEFNNNHSAKLAVEYGAVSVDHLLNVDDEGIESLGKKENQTVATLLPGTSFFLGKKPARGSAMVKKGCKVAMASDYNPGSCHFPNLIHLASMALPLYGFGLGQFWTSLTLNGAHALGLYDQGAIIKNFQPRFSLFKATTHTHIPYYWGQNLAAPLKHI
jgi:imidazolonepropionase